MAGNSFGKLFTVTTWGESHGPALGVVIDGCPAGLKIRQQEIQKELDRRKPGQSSLTTSRKEPDSVLILSGVFKDQTTGTPISLMVKNVNAQSEDYETLAEIYRPSHADYTYDIKFGLRDHRGGGRVGARETVGRVAAGAIAKKLLRQKAHIEIVAYVKKVHTIEAKINPASVTPADVEKNDVRCPDQVAAIKMIKRIETMKKEGDSVGGIIECIIRNAPAGLGSPVFDKLEARLAQAMLSLPASRGFEVGSGFAASVMKGSGHNDPLLKKSGKVITQTNHAGGVVGGVSNGMDIIFRVAFKPPASISISQKTISKNGKTVDMSVKGRHDPCVLPRAVVLVEAMAALVLADEYLIQKTVQV